MLTANALAAAKAAYDIEIACLTEMKDYFDDEAFGRAVELLAAAPRIVDTAQELRTLLFAE